MGRMTEVPMEAATHGSNTAAVARQHREARAREISERAARSLERLNAAAAWVRARRELCVNGDACPHAVVGALWLRNENNTNADLFSAVQAFRRDKYAKQVAKGDLSQHEVDQIMGVNR
jgi:hypothetical protein